MIKKIVGNVDFIENLRGKSASFALSISTTKTCEIEGITQAGIPGLIHLTPTLDAEFLCTGEVRSLESIAETPKGVPTPALISRAVHLLKPFYRLELFDLGAQVKPELDYFDVHSFGLNPSLSIENGANIEAKKLFDMGVEFASKYELKTDYLILAESVPSGTTTALTTALALGYDCKDKFSSSFKDAPLSIKQRVVESALKNIVQSDDEFDKLSKVSDNMLIFNAGFVVGACKRGMPLV
ncbi:nicotinate-nucleotide--dimethylbenzimidazole phosphoribosyltransferase, partial [Sulfurimonas sp.]|uniref:nicotinate-nucleotide--dimethylbenzimidazole phosphoribosyltransferase n=1 Tax=Sulfurimonas sp. TaxID=2022749 RepID=UPI002608016F